MIEWLKKMAAKRKPASPKTKNQRKKWRAVATKAVKEITQNRQTNFGWILKLK